MLIVNVDTHESRVPAPAADNWRGFPQSKFTIPTFSIGQVASGDALLERYTKSASPDNTESTPLLEMFSYKCKLPFCEACAYGLGNPSDNCTSNKCPGLDPAFSHRVQRQRYLYHRNLSVRMRGWLRRPELRKVYKPSRIYSHAGG